MKDEHKTKKQLIDELEELRTQISGLKKAGTGVSRMNEELGNDEQRFKFLYERAPLGYQSLNENGHFIEINQAFLDMLGYSREEVLGKWFGDFLHPDYVSLFKQRFPRFKEAGETHNAEFIMLRKDGSYITVSIDGKIGHDEDGNFMQTHCILHDVTKQKQTEENLILFKELVNQSNDAIFFANPETGHFVEVNETACRLHGYTRDEFLAKRVIDISASFPDESAWKNHVKELKEEKSVIAEFEGMKKDGSTVPLEVNIKLANYRGAEYIIAVSRDITERKKAEELLEYERKRFFAILDELPAFVYLQSPDYSVRYANKYFRTIFGDPEGKPCYETLRGAKEPCKPCLTFKCFDTKEPQEWEWTQPETGRTYQIYDYPFKDVDDSSLVLELGIAITERKKFEDALKMSEEKYRSLIENAGDAIISTDEEGIIVGLNKKAEEIFDYSYEEILGKSVFILAPHSSREAEKKGLEAFRSNRKAGLISNTTEKKGLRKNGEEIPIESSIFAVEVGGKFIITAISREISERKEMEKKLLQSEKLKSLGELAGGVAHDFNNVLAAILGNAQLLKLTIGTPQGIEERRKTIHELKQGLGIIEKAAKDGAETVKRIQEFARTRDEDKYYTSVNINEVITDALNFTKIRWKDEAESKEIKINIQKELAALPSTVGSGTELREVIVNLINNAIDAMPQGGDIKIKTFSEDDHVCISVKDTGAGIPSDRKERIFDPFFTTKGVQSSGLGLSVSYGIINRHRGTISVDSVEGEGATFTIKLPISDGVIEKEKEKAVQGEHRKAKILVIEDEEHVRDLLSAILLQGGHEVETASSGSRGIELFERNEFDMVFTDLGMPVMSGWQVAEKIKSIEEKVPVALITGWNIVLKESELQKSGVDLVVQKPFEVNQVLRLVQEGLMLRDKFTADQER